MDTWKSKKTFYRF